MTIVRVQRGRPDEAMTAALDRFQARTDQTVPFEAMLPDADSLARALIKTGELTTAISLLEAQRLEVDGWLLRMLLDVYDAVGREDRLAYWFARGDMHAERLLIARYFATSRLDDLRNVANQMQVHAGVPDAKYSIWRLRRLADAQIKVARLMISKGMEDDAIQYLRNLPPVDDTQSNQGDAERNFPRWVDADNITTEEFLIGLLVQHRRRDVLQELADAGSTPAAWALTNSKSPWIRVRIHSTPNYMLGPEPVQWVALAVASGVLGNAAYDMIKSTTVRARRKLAAQRTSSEIPKPEEAASGRPATEVEAVLLAYDAIEQRCQEIWAPAPDLDVLTYDAVCGPDGRWVLMFRNPDGNRYMVRVPMLRRSSDEISVLVYMSRGRESHRIFFGPDSDGDELRAQGGL